MMSRRAFLGTGAAGFAAVLARSGDASARRARTEPDAERAFIKPPHLRPGDTIGLINPVSVPCRASDIRSVTRTLEGIGLSVKWGTRMDRTRGDEERAAEVNALFEDPSVKAIVAIRGGWGSARLLPHLDYAAIRRHPKVFMGFSDVAALLLGIHARAGLVTFHGPMGMSSWVPYTVEQMKRVLFQSEAVTLANPLASDLGEDGPEERLHTIAPGRARGRLLGGNLTVLSSIVGSPYLACGEDIILFLEEVREPLSEVARKLTQLELAGILARARGLVFGQCIRCGPPQADELLTLEEVLAEQVERLGIPAWSGASIGHIERQLTLPIGVEAEIDAREGTIQLLEPAVS